MGSGLVARGLVGRGVWLWIFLVGWGGGLAGWVGVVMWSGEVDVWWGGGGIWLSGGGGNLGGGRVGGVGFHCAGLIG